MKLKRRRTTKKIKGFGIKRPYVNKRNRLMLGSGNIKRPYVNKRNRLMLGSGKKQRGGFIAPLVPLLAPVIAQVANKLFG